MLGFLPTWYSYPDQGCDLSSAERSGLPTMVIQYTNRFMEPLPCPVDQATQQRPMKWAWKLEHLVSAGFNRCRSVALWFWPRAICAEQDFTEYDTLPLTPERASILDFRSLAAYQIAGKSGNAAPLRPKYSLRRLRTLSRHQNRTSWERKLGTCILHKL